MRQMATPFHAAMRQYEPCIDRQTRCNHLHSRQDQLYRLPGWRLKHPVQNVYLSRRLETPNILIVTSDY